MTRWIVCGLCVLVLLYGTQVGCKLYEPPPGSTKDSGGSSESVTSEPVADSGGSNVTVETKPDTATSSSVPTTADELYAYLKKGSYGSWSRESTPHQTQGPHQSGALVYFNDILEQSFKDGNSSHPKGSVAIKQLYGADLATPAGWAVMIKVDEKSQNGEGWYWFEVFVSQNGPRYIADGKGVQLCTGCHAPGKDFIKTQYPLQ